MSLPGRVQVRRSVFVIALLVLLGVAGFFETGAAEWVTGRVRIAGTLLTVSPAAPQTVPLNTPTVVNTALGGSISQLPPTYVVRGEFSDENSLVYPQPLILTTTPNQPFQIPPLAVAGRYFLRHIQMLDGTRVLAEAVPSQVEIVAREILLSQVTSRPMTNEEIQQSGVLINQNDYKAVRFTIGLGTESGVRKIDFPVLFPKQDIEKPPVVLKKLGLPGPPPPPDVEPPGALPDLNLEPIQFQTELPYDDPVEQKLELSGLLVFPSTITFLNQFFAVGVVLQNGSPVESNLQLVGMTARIVFPDGSGFVLKQPTKPPLVNGVMPLATPLLPLEQAQGEFNVTTPKSGTYTVKIEFEGQVEGLATGKPARIKGKASGVIVVQDPTFHVNFTHPSVVRAGQEYSLLVTLSNTSTADANDLTLAFPDMISGALFLTGQNPAGPDNQRHLTALKAGDSQTVEFKLRALVTGQVRASTLSGGADVTGAIQLVTAVGDGGIPLSPDTLILPPVVQEQLPNDVVASALELLGLGWSLANAPPDQRPPHLAPISAKDVRELGNELTDLARFAEIAHSTTPPLYTAQNALQELALAWTGNRVQRVSFDAMRRLPGTGTAPYIPSKGEKFARVLGSHLVAEGQAILAAHETFAVTNRPANPHFSVAIDDRNAGTPPQVWLEDPNRHRLGDNEEGRLVRDLPFGELYPLPNGRMLVLGHLDGTENLTLHIRGTAAGTINLSVLAPLPGGVTLVQFADVPLAAGQGLHLDFAPGTQELVLVSDLDGSRVAAQATKVIPLPALTILGAEQDLMADQAGRAVAVLFNRTLDSATAQELSHYSNFTRPLTGAYLQLNQRLVEVRAKSRISPLVDNYLTISGVTAADGSPLTPDPEAVRVLTRLTGPAGSVRGTVFGADGAPLAGAAVDLWEFDLDYLREHQNDLEADPVHITQQVTTDASGQFFLDYVTLASQPFTIEATDTQTNDTASLRGTLTQNGQELTLSLFLRARGTVHGRVFGTDGLPARGALVTVRDLANPTSILSVTTDADGYYEVRNAPVGTLAVSAQAAGGAHAFATVHLERPGSLVAADLQLVATVLGGVRGRVVQADGVTPVAGTVVRVDLNGVPEVHGAVYTAADGSFLIPNLPPGPYFVTILDPVTRQVGRRLNATVAGQDTVDVGLIVLTKETGKGRVSGVLLYPDRTPGAGLTVYLVTAGNGLIAKVTTDASGGYAFADVALGDWKLLANDAARHMVAESSFKIAYDGQETTVNLYFPAQGSISGLVQHYVSGGELRPAAGVTVYLDEVGPRFVRTGAEGRFHFDDVPTGHHRLIAAEGSPATDVGRNDAFVSFDGQQIQDANITLLGRGDLEVLVQIPPAQPVGALVNVHTSRINPTTLELEPEILADHSDVTTGRVRFSGLLGTSVGISADNGFNGYGTTYATIAGGRTVQATVNLVQNGYLRGVVRRPDGITPCPYAVVTLETGSMPGRKISADQNGAFQFSVVPMGHLRVIAEDPETGRRGQSEGILSAQHTTVEKALVLDVRLLGEGSIQGLVLEDDGQGGTVPTANARVTIRGPQMSGTRTASTDLAGRFLFEGLREGAYSLEAIDLGHQFPIGGRADVTVARDTVAQTSIRLGAFGRVTGTVVLPLTPSGTAPVSMAQVKLTVTNPVEQVGYAITDADGRFVFDVVPVSAAAFTVEAFDQKTFRSAHGSGVLSQANATVDVTLSLNVVGSVSGTVFQYAADPATAPPVVRPEVWADLPAGAGRVQTTGDENGAYRLDGVPGGTFTVWAREATTGIVTRGQATLTQAQPDVTLDLRLPLTGSITGSVLRADGVTPVAGALVTLDDHHQVSTDNAGRFQFGGVAPGSYTLLARDAASPDAGRATAVVSAQQATPDITIQMLGLGTVRGIVKDPSGVGLAGFDVLLTNRNQIETSSTGPFGTDATGHFVFPNQRLGEITVSATAPAGSGDVRKGTASGSLQTVGGELELEILLARAGTVRGTLVDSESRPVRGASVSLMKTEGGTWYAGTDASGLFTFPVVPVVNDGRFTIFVTGPVGGHARGAGELGPEAAPAVDLGRLVLDTTPPGLTASEPADGAGNVSRSAVVRATFSEPLEAASVNGSNVRLIDEQRGMTIAGLLALSADGLTITFTPAQQLASDTPFALHLGTGLRDLNTNPAVEERVIRFRSLDDLPPVVVSSFPALGTAQVASDAVPFVIFSEPVELSGASFTLTSPAGDLAGGPLLDGTDPKKVLFQRNDPFALLQLNATYTLTVAGVKDLAGNTMATDSRFFNTLDTIAPAVTLTLSTSSVLPTKSITLRAEPTDNLGVARVDFYAGSIQIGSRDAAPYELPYAAPAQPGDVTLRAVAVDRGTNTAEADAVLTVTPDVTPPAVTLNNPVVDQEVNNGGMLTMRAAASDDTGVTGVEFRLQALDGTVLWSNTINSPPFETSYPVAGLTENVDRQVVARAFDAYGNATLTQPVLVHLVYNHAPVAILSAPTAQILAITGGSIHLAGQGSDVDGPVTGLAFLVDGAVVWNGPGPNGSFDYSITSPVGTALAFSARVTGDKGETADSAPVTLTVIADPGTTVHGQVVDEQGTGIAGASVTVAGSALQATSTAGGYFSIANVPTINPPLAVSASFVQDGATYSGQKAGLTPVVSGTTETGAVVLRNLNDTSAVKATLALEGEAIRVARWGATKAVVATASTTVSQNHVYLIDVARPEAPVLLATWTAEGVIQDMKVVGNWVYVAETKFKVVEIAADGTALTTVGALASGWNLSVPRRFAVKDQYAYLGNESSVWIIDVSVPSSPRLIGTNSAGVSQINSMEIYGNRLIAATSDPNYPALVGILDNPLAPNWDSAYRLTSTDFGSAGGANRVAISGKTLLVSRPSSGVTLFDLACGTKPCFLKTVATGGNPSGMTAAGASAYIALGSGAGVARIDDPAGAGVLSAKIPTPGQPKGVAVGGSALLVADGTAGLTTIIQKNNPPIVDINRISVRSSLTGAVVEAQAGAVLSANPPLSFAVGPRGGASVQGPVQSDGGFLGETAANPGDELLLAVADSSDPSLSTSVSLGPVPYGTAGAFLSVFRNGSGNALRLAAGSDFLVAYGNDQITVVDISVPGTLVSKATWSAQGTIHDVKVVGNLLYVGDDDFKILELSADRLTLAQVGSLHSGWATAYPNLIAVKDQYAYLGNEGSVWIIDVSVPSNPRLIGTSNVTGSPIWGLEIYGNRLVAALWNVTWPIAVATIDNPLSPIWNSSNWVHQTDLGSAGGARRLTIDGSQLYISRDAGASILDLSAGTKPVVRSSVPLAGFKDGLFHVGNELYVASGYGIGLNVVDTSNPQAPRLIISSPVPGEARDVVVRNGYAYIAAISGIIPLKIEGAQAPAIDRSLITVSFSGGMARVVGKRGAVNGLAVPLQLTAQNDDSSSPGTVTVQGDGSFDISLASSPGRQIVLTAADSATPSRSATVSVGPVPFGNQGEVLSVFRNDGGNAQRLAAGSDFLVAYGNDQITVVDISVPGTLVSKATWTAQGPIHDVKVVGNLLYVGDDDFKILELSADRLTLAQVGSLHSGWATAYPNLIAVKDQYAYLGNEGSVWIIDVSVPSNPRLMGTSNVTSSPIWGLEIYGNRLIAALWNATYSIAVATIDNPLSPNWNVANWISGTDLGSAGGARRLTIDGSQLYISRDAGASILDLSAGTKPVVKGSVALSGLKDGLFHLGNELYVASGYGIGLNVVDTTDPQAPKLIVSNPISGNSKDVVVRSGYAYVATGSGIVPLEIEGAQAPAIDRSLITVSFSGGMARVAGKKGAVSGSAVPLQLTAQNDDSSSPGTVTVQGDGSFDISLASSPGRQIVLTVADSATPSRSATATVGPVPFGNQGEALSVFRNGSGNAIRVAGGSDFLVAYGNDQITVVDISVPGTLVSKATWTAQGPIHDVKVVGNLLYVGDDDFKILELSADRLTLAQVGSLHSGWATDSGNLVAVKDQYAYLGNNGSVWIIDVSVPSNPRLMGTSNVTSSPIWGLEIYGNRLIAALWNATYPIAVATIDNPLSPNWNVANWISGTDLGSAGGARRLTIDGSQLYISRDAGASILDLSAGTKPVVRSSVPLTGLKDGLFHLGNELYVASGYGIGLNVVDTTDPQAPKLIVSNPISGNSKDVVVRNGYAYVATGSEIVPLKIEAPVAPSIERSLVSLSIHGGLVRLAGPAGTAFGQFLPLELTAQDGDGSAASPITVPVDGSFDTSFTSAPGRQVSLTVTDLASPHQSTNVPLGPVPFGMPINFLSLFRNGTGNAFRIANGSDFLVAYGNDQLSVIDLTVPNTPVLKATWTGQGTIHDVKVVGNRLYVGDDNFKILELSGDKNTLTLLGTVTSGWNQSNPNFVAINGNWAYLGNVGHIWVIDITNPAAPQYLQLSAIGNSEVRGLEVSGNRLFAAMWSTSYPVSVATLDNPQAPSWSQANWVSNADLGVAGGTHRLMVDGSWLYIVREIGTSILDLSAGNKPVVKSRLDLTGPKGGVYHSGHELYVTGGFGTALHVVDTTDPQAPRLIVSSPVPGAARDVIVRGAYAYVATGVGLWVVQLENGITP